MRVRDYLPDYPGRNKEVMQTTVTMEIPAVWSNLGGAVCQTLRLKKEGQSLSYIDFPLDTVLVCMEKTL